jgi:hypothetical protein
MYWFAVNQLTTIINMTTTIILITMTSTTTRTKKTPIPVTFSTALASHKKTLKN